MRLSVNPSKEWALQVSHGWLKSPEEAEPNDNVKRFTASAIHTKMLGENSYVATTFLYGQNTSHHGGILPSALAESSLQLNKNAIYGRYEFVVKDAGELDLTSQPDATRFNITAFTLGYNRMITTFKSTNLTIGTQATANFSPTRLRSLYGTVPVGFQVYLRLTPAIMKMGGMKM